MHPGHPNRCVVPKMTLGRILLYGVCLELFQEHLDLRVLRRTLFGFVVVVDRQEIRVLESQVVYGMGKWGHKKRLEEPKTTNV